MSTLSTLQFGFSGPGQRRGVFSSLSYIYPETLTVEGQFTVSRRVLTDAGTTEDLGLVDTVKFKFSPADFGLNPATMQPDPNATPAVAPARNPATDALVPGQSWSAAALFAALYSWQRHLTDLKVAAEAPPPAQPE